MVLIQSPLIQTPKDPLEVWQNIPLEIRNSELRRLFKSNIKQIQSLSCRCKSCRSFIANQVYREYSLFYTLIFHL